MVGRRFLYVYTSPDQSTIPQLYKFLSLKCWSSIAIQSAYKSQVKNTIPFFLHLSHSIIIRDHMKPLETS